MHFTGTIVDVVVNHQLINYKSFEYVNTDLKQEGIHTVEYINWKLSL